MVILSMAFLVVLFLACVGCTTTFFNDLYSDLQWRDWMGVIMNGVAMLIIGAVAIFSIIGIIILAFSHNC